MGRKLKVKLREMKDAEAHYISLVQRGANRIPFRIVKMEQENSMIDLNSIGRVLKREAAARVPEVTAIVVEKGEAAQFDAVKKALDEAGFPTDTVKDNGDGSVSFVFKADADAGTTMVRMSGDCLALVRHFPTIDNPSALKADGFVHGPATAFQFASRLMAQGDAEGAKVVGDYGTAVKAALPPAAISANEVVQQALKALSQGGTMNRSAVNPQDDTNADGAKTPSGGASGAAAVAANPVGESTGSTNDNGDVPAPAGFDAGVWESLRRDQKLAILGWTSQKGDKCAPGAANNAAAEPDEDDKKKQPVDPNAAPMPVMQKAEVADAIAAALAPITQQITNLSQALASVTKAQKEQADKVASFAAKAEQAEKAVKGTVLNPPPGGDAPAGGVQTAKKNDDPRSGCFDTAFLPK